LIQIYFSRDEKKVGARKLAPTFFSRAKNKSVATFYFLLGSAQAFKKNICGLPQIFFIKWFSMMLASSHHRKHFIKKFDCARRGERYDFKKIKLFSLARTILFFEIIKFFILCARQLAHKIKN